MFPESIGAGAESNDASIGSVTCVQVVGQDAWVAGRVKKSDPADSIFGGIVFRIHPDDAAPLGFQVVTAVESTAAAAVADCTERFGSNRSGRRTCTSP